MHFVSQYQKFGNMPRRQSCFVGDLDSSQINLIDGPRRNRRKSVSNMLNQRRKSVYDFFKHKSPDTFPDMPPPPPSPEYLLLKKKMAEKAMSYKRRYFLVVLICHNLWPISSKKNL